MIFNKEKEKKMIENDEKEVKVELEEENNEIKVEVEDWADIEIKKEIEVIHIDREVKTEIHIQEPENVTQNSDYSPKRRHFRILISNLHYSVDQTQLRDLFVEKIGCPVFCHVYKSICNMPKGMAIIEYNNEILFKKCMETMQAFEVKGRRIILQSDEGIERDIYGNIKTPGSISQNSPTSSPFVYADPINQSCGTYGLSERFLLSLGINGHLTNRVFIRNLDVRVNDEKLREVFSIAGQVINAQITHDRMGRHSGCGIVQYDHPLEAVQSISMLHNRLLFDKILFIKLDQGNRQYLSVLPIGLGSIGPGLGTHGETLHNFSLNKISNAVAKNVSLSGISQSRRARRSFPY